MMVTVTESQLAELVGGLLTRAEAAERLLAERDAELAEARAEDERLRLRQGELEAICNALRAEIARLSALTRVDTARGFPANTCPASRHAQMYAEALIKGTSKTGFSDPGHLGESILATVAALYEARAALATREAETLERAAKIVEAMPDRVLYFYDRPGSPPGNGWRQTTRADCAVAIRAALTNRTETGGDA